jgi:hypothetical protein
MRAITPTHHHHSARIHIHAPALIMRALIRPRSPLRRPQAHSQAICPQGIACRLRRYYIPMRHPRLSQMRHRRNNNLQLFQRRSHHDIDITQNVQSHMHTPRRIASALVHWLSQTRCRMDISGDLVLIVDWAIVRDTTRRVREPRRSSRRSRAWCSPQRQNISVRTLDAHPRSCP